MLFQFTELFQRDDIPEEASRRPKIAWGESTRAICGMETEVVFLSPSLEEALFLCLTVYYLEELT